MRRRTFSLAAAVSAAGLALSSCSGSGDAERGPDDELIVTFWHSMRGNNAEQLESFVEEFNESQSEIRIDASFQGMYDEAQTKLMQVVGTKDAPDLMQLGSGAKREIIDSGIARPMQELIDAAGFDTSTIQPSILSSRQVDDMLHAMPQATSAAVMFFNRDLFEEAGLDPDAPPQAFSEIREASQTLVDAGLVTHGIAMLTDGGPLLDMMANQGELLLDNDNGRSGRPTEAVFNSEAGVETMTWVRDMHADGLLANFGRSLDDLRPPWYAGDVAMILDTSAASIIHDQETDFAVGAGYFPVPDGVESQGSVIGGADLWIFADSAEETQTAAFGFVTHLLEPEVQARWAAGTGYYPITTASYDEPVLIEAMEETESIRVANAQIGEGETSPASLGPVSGVGANPYVADAWERIYDGADPQAELDAAAAEVTSALESYNDANG